MNNEYPPPSTLMNQPSINGNIVASDVYDNYINNELHKSIDDYWQSKYKTFAKGRIKRMRSKYVGSFFDYLTKPNRKKYADAFPRCNATITRWNRH